MILPHKNIEELKPKDIDETLIYVHKSLSEWEAFRIKTNDFCMRQTADKEIRRCKEKIEELSKKPNQT